MDSTRHSGATVDATHQRTRVPRKQGGADLRSQYRLTLELGMVVALGVVIGAFRVPLQQTEEFDYTPVQQETVQMEEIQQTQQVEQPPPPPRPRVPVAVADDVVLEDEQIDFDASLDLNEPAADLPAPPPPPPVEEEAVEEEPEIFMIVEQMPELIGGIGAIQRCVQYPEIAQKAGIEGRVFVEFVVNPEGNPTDPRIVRGIGGGTDEEAIRCVMQAKFKPGKQRGKAVSVRYVIPVRFVLADG